MPWSAESFKKKHNQSLTGAQAEKAASIANAILRESGDEAKAIRIANFQAKRKKKELTWTTPRREADLILKERQRKGLL